MRLNVGVIGAGLIGNAHMMSLMTCIEEDVLAGSADVAIAGIADIDTARLEERADLYDVKNTTTNGHDLCKNEDIDVIFVCTPTNAHHEFVVSAARHGKHVFVEKPVGTLPQVRDMIEVTRAAGVACQVGLVLRYHPLFWYARHLIARRGVEFGPLQNVIFRDDQEYPYTGSGMHPSTWRSDKTIAYHGTLFEHSIHDLDQIMLACGKVKSVAACIKEFNGKDGIEDSASVLLDFHEGATASLNSIWYQASKDTRRAEFFFKNGCIELELGFIGSGSLQYKLLNAKTVKVSTDEINDAFNASIFPGMTMPRGTPYFYEDAAFLRTIVQRSPAWPVLDDALAVHEVLEACYEASSRGTVVAMGATRPA